MSTLVGRHGVSKANDKSLPAYGHPDAPLLELGHDQAATMGEKAQHEFGIDVTTTEVAVSTMRRTQQTAISAGFKTLHIYKTLDEVSIHLTPREILLAKQTNVVPKIAIQAAEAILEDPPEQIIWVTHGLIIAGLCEVLGVADRYRFIPKFCELRELPI